MIKRVVLKLSYVIFALLMLLYLFPKTSLYYMLEEQLLEKEIVLSNEKINEGLLSLTLKQFDIYYKKQYVLKAKELVSSYSLATPLELHIDAKGEFGTLYGNVELNNRKVIVVLRASSWMKKSHGKLLSSMKLTRGVYTYEFQY